MKAALSIALAGTTVAVLLIWSAYPREAIYMAGIFVLAGSLWITEALPLFVTALIVIGAQIIVLANPAGWPFLGYSSGVSPSVQTILSGAADQVLLLFLGGFMLARAAERTEVARVVSAWLLAPFGDRPAWFLLGVMVVTATFSMWMSNTATTAMMIAVLAPLLLRLAPDDPMRKAVMLAVPFAANIGGLGTPIASPPNAVAIGYLEKAGHPIAFLEWMLVAVPLMVGLLLFTWLLLSRAFPPAERRVPMSRDQGGLTPRGRFVVVVFSLTVALWVTGGWHGLPAAVVALVPVVALTATRVLTEDDLNRLDWTILILIAGGISLGVGMQMSGLDAIVVSWLPSDATGSARATAAVLVVAVLVLGTFMSNTAVANLLLPVAISVGIASGSDGLAVELTVSVALAASLAMSLPISTPPNAIAYARGVVAMRDMARTGAVVGVVSALLIIAFAGMVMRFWGVA